jgi:hypothetical protein
MTTLFGRLFDPDDRGVCVVTIDGPNVTAIEPATEPRPGCLGGPSSRIVPGLLDIQLNGAFGDDFADPSADLGRIARGLTRFGITGFVPTIVTSPAEAYAPALQNLRRSAGQLEARVLGVPIEGPFISPRYLGTHDPALLRLPDVAEARAWLEAGDIRYLTLAPELPRAVAHPVPRRPRRLASRWATRTTGPRPRWPRRTAARWRPPVQPRCACSGTATRAWPGSTRDRRDRGVIA